MQFGLLMGLNPFDVYGSLEDSFPESYWEVGCEEF